MFVTYCICMYLYFEQYEIQNISIRNLVNNFTKITKKQCPYIKQNQHNYIVNQLMPLINAYNLIVQNHLRLK